VSSGFKRYKCAPGEPEEEGTMNITMGEREERWHTPDGSWLDMETIEDEETFFANISLGDMIEFNIEMKEVVCFKVKEEYITCA
jgi:hypothetical protein